MSSRRAHLPRDVSPLAAQRLVREYANQAARLRELAANLTTPRLKARLLEEADNQERMAHDLKSGGFSRGVTPRPAVAP